MKYFTLILLLLSTSTFAKDDNKMGVKIDNTYDEVSIVKGVNHVEITFINTVKCVATIKLGKAATEKEFAMAIAIQRSRCLVKRKANPKVNISQQPEF